MEISWKWLTTCLGLLFFQLCNGFPINLEDSVADQHTQLLTGLVAVLLTVCSVVLLAGCLCCQRRNGFKEFRDSPVVASTASNLEDHGHVNPIANGEFTIFTPLSSSPYNNNVFLANERIITRTAEDFIYEDFDVSSWFNESEKDFPRIKLKYIKELGKGWFGKVVEGAAKEIPPNEEAWTPVVVRILEATASRKERVLFLNDAAIYRCGTHANILSLIGRCLDTVPLLLLQEYCPQGDLKHHLRSKKGNVEQLLSTDYPLLWCCQLTSALKHLHDNGVAHPDLATRNCQLTSDLTLKVGDYGLAENKYPEDYYQGSFRVPVRWCSPESLTCTLTTIQPKKATAESNIWSLGVTMWEICECGAQPYSPLSDDEVVSRVLGPPNVRLSRPSFPVLYTDYLYRLMQLCWTNAESRPTVAQIDLMLTDLWQVHKNTKDSGLSADDFDKRWESLKPNSKKEIVADNTEMEELGSTITKPLSPSLNNLHGSLDNLLNSGDQMELWLENVTKSDVLSLAKSNSNVVLSLDDPLVSEISSSDSSDRASPKNKKSKLKSKIDFDLNTKFRDSNIKQPYNFSDSALFSQRTSSESETEDENWRKKVERGAYTEKVRLKSRSVADLMILTHVDYSESESETPLPSLDYRVNYKNVRYAPKNNLENVSLTYGSEGNLLSVHDTFQEELKKLKEERRDSLLFVPDNHSQTSFSKLDNINHDFPTEELTLSDSNLNNTNVIESTSKRLMHELNRMAEIQPANQVFNVFSVTIDKFKPIHVNSCKLNDIINFSDIEPCVTPGENDRPKEQKDDGEEYAEESHLLVTHSCKREIDFCDTNEKHISDLVTETYPPVLEDNLVQNQSNDVGLDRLSKNNFSSSGDVCWAEVQESNGQSIHAVSSNKETHDEDFDSEVGLVEEINSDKLLAGISGYPKVADTINPLPTANISGLEVEVPLCNTDNNIESSITTINSNNLINKKPNNKKTVDIQPLEENSDDIFLVAAHENVIKTSNETDPINQEINTNLVLELSEGRHEKAITNEFLVQKAGDKFEVPKLSVIIKNKTNPCNISEKDSKSQDLLRDIDTDKNPDNKVIKNLQIPDILNNLPNKNDADVNALSESDNEKVVNSELKTQEKISIPETDLDEELGEKNYFNEKSECESQDNFQNEDDVNKETQDRKLLISETEMQFCDSNECERIVCEAKNAVLIPKLSEILRTKFSINDDKSEDRRNSKDSLPEIDKTLSESKFSVNTEFLANEIITSLKEFNVASTDDRRDGFSEVLQIKENEHEIEPLTSEIFEIENDIQIPDASEVNSKVQIPKLSAIIKSKLTVSNENVTSVNKNLINSQDLIVEKENSQPESTQLELKTESQAFLENEVPSIKSFNEGDSNHELNTDFETNEGESTDMNEIILADQSKYLEKHSFHSGQIITDSSIETHETLKNENEVSEVPGENGNNSQSTKEIETNCQEIQENKDLNLTSLDENELPEGENRNSVSEEKQHDLSEIKLIDTTIPENVIELDEIVLVDPNTVSEEKKLQAPQKVINEDVASNNESHETPQVEDVFNLNEIVCVGINEVREQVNHGRISEEAEKDKYIEKNVIRDESNSDSSKGNQKKDVFDLNEIILEDTIEKDKHIEINTVSGDTNIEPYGGSQKKDVLDVNDIVLLDVNEVPKGVGKDTHIEVDITDDQVNSDEKVPEKSQISTETGDNNVSNISNCCLYTAPRDLIDVNDIVLVDVNETLKEKEDFKCSEDISDNFIDIMSGSGEKLQNDAVDLSDVIVDIDPNTYIVNNCELSDLTQNIPNKQQCDENEVSNKNCRDVQDNVADNSLDLEGMAIEQNMPHRKYVLESNNTKKMENIESSDNLAEKITPEATYLVDQNEQPLSPSKLSVFTSTPAHHKLNNHIPSHSNHITLNLFGVAEEKEDAKNVDFYSGLVPLDTSKELNYSLETWDNFLGKTLDAQNDVQNDNLFDSFTSEPHSLLFVENGNNLIQPYEHLETNKRQGNNEDLTSNEDVIKSDINNGTFVIEDKTFVVEENNRTFDINKTETVEPEPEDANDNSTWGSGGGWFLHPQTSNKEPSGTIEVRENTGSYVGFGIDDEIMAAIRNELLNKLPHAQVAPTEKVSEVEEWDSNEKNEVFLKYNIYNPPLSPILEESYMDESDIITPKQESDNEDSEWSEPDMPETLPPEPESQSAHTYDSQMKGPHHRHTPSQDSCCSNDTLFNLEELTCVAGDVEKENDLLKVEVREIATLEKNKCDEVELQEKCTSQDNISDTQNIFCDNINETSIKSEANNNINNMNLNSTVIIENLEADGDTIQDVEVSQDQLFGDSQLVNSMEPKIIDGTSYISEFISQEIEHSSKQAYKLNEGLSSEPNSSQEDCPIVFKKTQIAPLPSPEDNPWKQLPASLLSYDKVISQNNTLLLPSTESNKMVPDFEDLPKDKDIIESPLNNISSEDPNEDTEEPHYENYNVEEQQNAYENIKDEQPDYENIKIKEPVYENVQDAPPVYENMKDPQPLYQNLDAPSDIYNEVDYVNIVNLENSKNNQEYISVKKDYVDSNLEESKINVETSHDEDIYGMLTDIKFNGPTENQLISTSFSESNDINDEQDWDSGSDTRSSSSGEFIWKEGEHEESLKALRAAPQDVLENVKPMEGITEESTDESDMSSTTSDEEGEAPEFVPSAWDKFATPTKSALRSPEKTLEKSEKKKSKGVWFKKQKYHCVYEYPREPESPVLQSQDLWKPQLDYSSFTDWEFDADTYYPSTVDDNDIFPSAYNYQPKSISSRNLYQLTSISDFVPSNTGLEDEFFVSSSARPFDATGNLSSQFFPGSANWTGENATPDSGMEDSTPGSSTEISEGGTMEKNMSKSVQSLKKLASEAIKRSKQMSIRSNDTLGGLRHTRNKLKLDLPPSPSAFTSTKMFSVEPTLESVIREKPTFTTFGKSRFSVQHVDTPPEDSKNKNVSFEALPYKPLKGDSPKIDYEKESYEDVEHENKFLQEKQILRDKFDCVKGQNEFIRGEASLLDSADEDSGIESSTLERKLSNEGLLE